MQQPFGHTCTSVHTIAIQAGGLEERLLAEVGDGGFTSDDFEIVTRLGHISVQQGTAPGMYASPQTAVIAYAARYIARIAYSLPVTTLVKVRAVQGKWPHACCGHSLDVESDPMETCNQTLYLLLAHLTCDSLLQCGAGVHARGQDGRL
jgi:hypothetical protein